MNRQPNFILKYKKSLTLSMKLIFYIVLELPCQDIHMSFCHKISFLWLLFYNLSVCFLLSNFHLSFRMAMFWWCRGYTLPACTGWRSGPSQLKVKVLQPAGPFRLLDTKASQSKVRHSKDNKITHWKKGKQGHGWIFKSLFVYCELNLANSLNFFSTFMSRKLWF